MFEGKLNLETINDCGNLTFDLLVGPLPVPQISSVAQSCRTLCDPMDCSTPGLPVHYQLLELAQTYVLQVGDGIKPSHSLSSPSTLSSLASFLCLEMIPCVVCSGSDSTPSMNIPGFLPC